MIGLSFIYELFLVDIDWPMAVEGWVTPAIPKGSMLIIMSVLGAVVMPHNLFLHSEVIQSHEYNKQDTASIKKVLKYELFDTLFSMIIGWAINSAMILLAAATFFKSGIQVEELQQAKSLLEPLLGSNAAIVFALALLMAGISSTITSGMAAGSIFAGIFGESYHIKDSHSQVGVILSLGIALLLIFFIGDPFKGLIISQMVLSIQLPFTVFLQVGLTSSRKVMGDYVNSKWSTFVLYTIAVILFGLQFGFLQTKHIGIFFGQPLGQPLVYCGTKSVHIISYNFHLLYFTRTTTLYSTLSLSRQWYKAQTCSIYY